MDDEIDLRQYLSVLWKRRYVIGAVTIAAILAAALLSFLIPPTFEARAMILVTKSALQVGGAPDSPGPKIAAFLSSEIPTETLMQFAKSESTTRKVLARAIPQDSTARGPDELTAQVIRSTNLVELKVRGTDPNRAAKLANEWARIVATESEALFATEANVSYAFFDTRLEEAKARLEAAEKALRGFNASSKIGILQARLNAITSQISSYQSRQTDLSVSLQKAETELAQTEAQIGRQPKTLTLSKSITTDPFLQQTASDVTKQDFAELSKLRLNSEELNPVYVNLDQSRADLSIQVAALRTERAKIADALTQMNRELTDLRSPLALQQLEQTQLTRAVENAKQVYDVLLQRREEARVASASQAGSVKPVAEAMVPLVPVSPRKALNITLAAVLGLMAGTMVALIVEYFAPLAAVPGAVHASPIPTNPGRGDVSKR